MFECPICYKHRRKITTLNCEHQICTFCWEKWRKKELDFYHRTPTCPLCRAPQDTYRAPNWSIYVVAGLTWYALWHSSTPSETPAMA